MFSSCDKFARCGFVEYPSLESTILSDTCELLHCIFGAIINACLSTKVRSELKRYWPILGTELKVPEPLALTPSPSTSAEVNHLFTTSL